MMQIQRALENIPSLMKVLSNETNLQISSILKSGSSNPRELARIFQKDETDISRIFLGESCDGNLWNS